MLKFSGIIQNQLEFVDLNKEIPTPQLVTATSANHAGEARHLILRMTVQNPTWKIVLYDIGLTEKQRLWFKVC